ncbi:MAG: hypothetical protein ACLUQK_17090 [Clostridium sp.]
MGDLLDFESFKKKLKIAVDMKMSPSRGYMMIRAFPMRSWFSSLHK